MNCKYFFSLVCLSFTVLFASSCSEKQDKQSSNYDGPIIDVHLHDYAREKYYVAPAADGVVSPPTYQQYKKEVMAMLKKMKVEHAIVSTNGAQNTLDEEGILIPGMYTEETPKDTLEFIQLIEEGKLKVFGEIGAVYVGKTLSDSDFDPYLAICDRYDIPVAIHTGGGPAGITVMSPFFRISKGDPYTIEDVLVKYPNLRVYMMHAGTTYYEHTLEVMRTYPRVYADLGVILWWDKPEMDVAEAFLRKAKRYGFIDRVLYGSDQMVWPHAIEKSINQLNSYDFLTLEDKEKIFYKNAKEFLKLED